MTSPAILPDATVGEPYSFQLTTNASGYGVTWSAQSSAQIPDGMSFSGDGVLSGTPTQAGTYVIGVGAGANSSVQTPREYITITVLPASTSGDEPTPSAVVTQAGAGGSIDGTSFAVSANENYVIDQLFVDGAEIAVASGQTSHTPSPLPTKSIFATFRAASAAVLVRAGYGGSIDGASYAVTASSGYVIDQLFVDGAEIAAASGQTSYTPSPPPAASIVATFAYTVNFNTPDNGTLTVARANGNLSSGTIVRGGDVLTITATANASYVLSSLSVNGTPYVLGSTGVYTYTVGSSGAKRTVGGKDVMGQGADIVAAFAVDADPPASDNSITGITAGRSYQQGDTLRFTANGGGMNNTAPETGDRRYLPTAWEAAPSGDTWSSAPYSASFPTAGMALGDHTLTVTFTRQQYDGTAWTNLSPAETDQKSVTFTLVEVVVPPTVDPPETAPDRIVGLTVGDTATLRVTATGEGPLSYQWFRSRGPGQGFSAIPDETDSSYTTAPVTLENEGYRYYCVVSNGADAQSGVFVLRVTEPAALPPTGDSARPALWAGLLLAAGAGLAATALPGRRRRRRG